MALVKTCPTCEFSNPPTSPFCAECGISLVSVAPTDPTEPPSAPINPKPIEIVNKACPDCGAQNDGSSDRCIYCDCVFQDGLDGNKCPQIELIWPWGKQLLTEPLRIGRDAPASAVLIKAINDLGYDNISRSHADLLPGTDNTCASVVDLGSSNGTFVNGERIPAHKPVPLKHGSVVRFAANLAVEISLM